MAFYPPKNSTGECTCILYIAVTIIKLRGPTSAAGEEEDTTGARPLTGRRINKSQLRELMQRVILSPRPCAGKPGCEGEGISIAHCCRDNDAGDSAALVNPSPFFELVSGCTRTILHDINRCMVSINSRFNTFKFLDKKDRQSSINESIRKNFSTSIVT